MGRVSLHVKVDYQSFLACRSTDGRQVACDRRLSNTTLLIEYHPEHIGLLNVHWDYRLCPCTKTCREPLSLP